MAQTIWYIPTGLDIWNQKIAKAPGHYSRGFQMPDGPPPAPVVHWPDQAPLALDGPLKERLGQWMTLVHRGQVIDAYRVFLGLMQNPAERRAALAELCFAGLIDVQDRSFQNRSYTTGHKSFRARATVELGEAIGWDDAHDVLYAGALDIAVGPRWYSLYEVACNAITVYLEGQTPACRALQRHDRAGARDPGQQQGAARRKGDRGADRGHPAPARARLSAAPHGAPEGRQEPARAPRRHPGRRRRRSRSRPTTSSTSPCRSIATSTCNTLGWFWDTFDHPQRLKLLYLAAAYLNQNAWHQKLTGDLTPARIETQAIRGLDAEAIASRVEAACVALDSPKALGWIQACARLAASTRRRWCVRIAMACSRLGNDPHNQEIALCMLEDFGKNRNPLTAAACCWPPRSTRRGIASTATRWTAAAASARRWASRPY